MLDGDLVAAEGCGMARDGAPPERIRDPADPAAWDARYREQNTPWDLGDAPPALRRLLGSLPPGRLRVLVPGAGPGHDAIAWARAGHDVVAVDFAPSAVAAARARARKAGVSLEVVEADVFALPPEFAGAFDVVWEQTCYCAIPLDRRRAYATAMARALKPGGVFLGLLWHHGQEGGPPFDVTVADVRGDLAEAFEEVSIEPVVDSVESRASEFLATFRVREGRTARRSR
jgi:SAM-dependent methyltransferase